MSHLHRVIVLLAFLGLLGTGTGALGAEPATPAEPAAEEPAAEAAEDPPAEAPPETPDTVEEGAAPTPGEEKPPEEQPAEGDGEDAKPPQEAAAEPAPEPTEAEAESAPDPERARRREVGRATLRHPFRGGRNSFLHSLVYIPPMRAGGAFPPSTGVISLSAELTKFSGAENGADAIDAQHLESAIHVSYALTDMVEFHGSGCGALFAGDASLTWSGAAMVPAPRDERLRVSRLVLGTKFNLLPLGGDAPDLWACLDFKIQGTEEDLADSGTPGLAFSLLLTHQAGPVTVHLNFGWALSDGQASFPMVLDAATNQLDSLPVNRIFFWGLSLVLPLNKHIAVALQGLGNTNGFRELAVLDSDVHVIQLGLRYFQDRFFVELAGGAGVTESSADVFGGLELGMVY